MKQLIKAGVFSSVLSMTAAFAVTANAAATVVNVSERMCSRDFNPWGKSSVCQCPDESTYDSRIGLCIQGSYDDLQAQGQVTTEVMAIGGETTGVVFQSDEIGDFELVLPIQLKQRLDEQTAAGTQFFVEGDFLYVPGVETVERPTVIVKSLTPIQNFGQ